MKKGENPGIAGENNRVKPKPYTTIGLRVYKSCGRPPKPVHPVRIHKLQGADCQ